MKKVFFGLLVAIFLVGCATPTHRGPVTPIGVAIVHQDKGVDVAILSRAWCPNWYSVRPDTNCWRIQLCESRGDTASFCLPSDRPVVIRFIDDKGAEVKRIDLEPQNQSPHKIP